MGVFKGSLQAGGINPSLSPKLSFRMEVNPRTLDFLPEITTEFAKYNMTYCIGGVTDPRTLARLRAAECEGGRGQRPPGLGPRVWPDVILDDILCQNSATPLFLI